MKILGYMQVHNEERFAPHALRSVIDVVDNMVVTLDRCTDKTKERLNEFRGKADFQEIAPGEDSAEQLTNLMKNLFVDSSYDWIFIVRGDEIYHESIKDLRAFLQKHPLDDVYRVMGYTIFIANDVYTQYTDPLRAKMNHSSTLLLNNNEIEEVLECNRWGPLRMKCRSGSPTVFDSRNGMGLYRCPTSFHMHFCTRSETKTVRPHSPDEDKYKVYIEKDQGNLYKKIFEDVE